MRLLAFGEILWDINGEERNIGGAPLNVAGHVSRLGGESFILSAIGDDELGRESLKCLDELSVDRSFVSTSPYETGKAIISLTDGIPSYTFTTPSAWDDIRLSDEMGDRLSSMHFDAVVYGTLASRSETSASTLASVLETIDADEFFFDVNLRLDFYSPDLIRRLLEKATILKMNDEEVPVIATAIGVDARNIISGLFASYSKLCKILVTEGKRGSWCHTRGESFHADCARVRVASTVGAGDSLSAAFLFFNSLGEDTQSALDKAARLADYVVTKEGAIPQYDEELRKSLLI